MRRTDISRRMGKAISIVEESFVNNTLTTKDIVKIVGNELDLKAGRAKDLEGRTVVIFKDNDFEGTLKKSDIYNSNSELKEIGVKDIKNNYGSVQLIHYFRDRIELSLIVEAECTDNNGDKHKVYVNLKTLETSIAKDDIEDRKADVNKEEVVEEIEEQKEVEVIEEVLEEKEKTYKDYIGEAFTRLFGERYFGSVPSDKFKQIMIDKIHGIYVVSYLELLYTEESIKDNDSEGIRVIDRLLNTL